MTAKIALITGAARGIGLATAKRFLADGWRVALLDIDGETLARSAAALNEPERTLALICDVAAPDQVEAAVAQVKHASARSTRSSTMPAPPCSSPRSRRRWPNSSARSTSTSQARS